VTNSVNANGDPAGIVAIYPEGMGEVQNAEVTNLLVTWHLPTDLVDSFNITLGNWTYLGSYSVADSVLDYQPAENGNLSYTVPTSGLTAYEFEYNGTLSTTTQQEGSLTPDPASYFTAEAVTSSDSCPDPQSGIEAVYVTEYSIATDSGYSVDGFTGRVQALTLS
jgi:hypothetical protein